MTARYSADDLAALAMASAIYISVYVGLTGVVSALAPIAGQLFGAKRYDEIGEEVRQAIWLAVLLSLFGALVLWNADLILDISQVSLEIHAKASLSDYQPAWPCACSLPSTMRYLDQPSLRSCN
jgi:MATE family multidrug resistance protein